MIKAVIFDCFGVLVGSGFDQTYMAAGGDPDKDRQFISDILLRANKGMITGENFRQEVADQIGIEVEVWNEEVKKSEQQNTELLEFVKQLHGEQKTAILSNVNKGVLHRKIDDKILKDDFDEVVESASVGLIKPDPEIYKFTAKKLGVEPQECIFIDDNPGFVAAAEAVGMQGIVHKDSEATIKAIKDLIA